MYLSENKINNNRVITIDGPGGVGKGTISALLADQLGWNYLDSGALYRLTALACKQKGIAFDDIPQVAQTAASLQVRFLPSGEILLDNIDVEPLIRTEQCGNNASIVAVIKEVRDALFKRQQEFLQAPGLVADGRDMGTAIFPQAPVKIFLTASPEERAKRRYKQLIEKGNNVNLASLLREIKERDDRDTNRLSSPLKPAEDAHVLDTSNSSIDEVFKKVSQYAECIDK